MQSIYTILISYLDSGPRPEINHLVQVREVNCSTKHHEVMSIRELEHIFECFEVCSNINAAKAFSIKLG